MKRQQFAFLVLFLCGFPPQADEARAFECERKISSPIRKTIDFITENLNSLQGGALAIVHDGHTVYQTTFGHACGKDRPITPRTLFPLASASKPVSALAVALQVKRGQISFSEQIKFSYLKKPVSLEMILSHTTGYLFRGNHLIEKGLSFQEIGEKVRTLSPQTSPSSFYSNFTYNLVAEVLGQKGVPFSKAISDLSDALDSPGLRFLTAPPEKRDLPIACPHSKSGKCLKFPPYYPRTVPASAGIFASLEAMIQLLKLSLGEREDVLSREELARLYNQYIINEDPLRWGGIKWPGGKDKISAHYGFGWRILSHKDHPQMPFVFHSGWIEGVRTFIGFIPSKKVGIVYLLNHDKRAQHLEAMQLWFQYLRSA